jgi:pyrroline-5-carboxylate reductase
MGRSGIDSVTTPVAFLGAGRMASAMLRRFTAESALPPNQLLLTHHDSQRALALSKELGIRATTSNRNAVESCRTIFICVRPQSIRSLLDEISVAVTPEHTVVSIALGVSLRWLRAALPGCGAILHLHPSSLVVVSQEGYSFVVPEQDTRPDLVLRLVNLCEAMGPVLVTNEEMVDRYAVFAGCAPAFFARLAECWRSIAVDAGIPDETIRSALAAMLRGLAAGGGSDPDWFDTVISRIATPNGATAAGLLQLDGKGALRTLQATAAGSSERIQEIRRIFE